MLLRIMRITDDNFFQNYYWQELYNLVPIPGPIKSKIIILQRKFFLGQSPCSSEQTAFENPLGMVGISENVTSKSGVPRIELKDINVSSCQIFQKLNFAVSLPVHIRNTDSPSIPTSYEAGKSPLKI